MKEKLLIALKSKLLFSLALNAIAAVMCIVLTAFVYDGNTDYYHSINISQNHFYYSSEINFILATVIGAVQYVMDSFNCFVLAQIVFSYTAFVSITFVLTDKFKKRKALIFAIIINILFSLNHYSHINSDKTAAIMMLAGFMLVLDAIRNKKYSLPCWLGVVEIAFGSFFNYSYFFVSLGFAVSFFLSDLIAKKKYKLDFRKLFWYFRPFVLMFILITALVMGLFRFSYTINHATDTATNYYEYSTLKTSIETLPYPDYSGNEEEFEKTGISSESEYELLKSGYYDSDKSLNLNALKTVSEIQQKSNAKTLFYAAGNIFTDLTDKFYSLNPSLIYTVFFVLLSVAFIVYHRNRFIPFPCFYLGTAFVSSVLLRYYIAGYDYLIYGIRLHAIVLLIYSFNFEYVRNRKGIKLFGRFRHKYMIASVFAAVVLFAGSFTLYSLNGTDSVSSKTPRYLITEISRNPDKYYVMDTASYDDFVKHTENYMHPLWGFRGGYLENLDTFGYFHNNEIMRKRKMSDNIYEAVLNSNKIYVIDKNFVFRKEKYFTDNYTDNGQRAVYNHLNEFDSYKLYEVSIE